MVPAGPAPTMIRSYDPRRSGRRGVGRTGNDGSRGEKRRLLEELPPLHTRSPRGRGGPWRQPDFPAPTVQEVGGHPGAGMGEQFKMAGCLSLLPDLRSSRPPASSVGKTPVPPIRRRTGRRVWRVMTSWRAGVVIGILPMVGVPGRALLQAFPRVRRAGGMGNAPVAIARAHVVPGTASELTGEPLGDRTMRRIKKPMRPAALALVALGVLLARDGRAAESQPPSQAPKPKGAPGAAAAAKVGPQLEPKAIDILKAVSAAPGRRPLDDVHGGHHLREPEPPRPAARLHDEVRGDPAAARQAPGDHARRRSRLRVLLRRQDDDGLRAGREPRRRRRRPADDRRRAEGGLRLGGDLLPVHRRDRRRPLQGHRRRAEASPSTSANRTWSAARRPTWWRSPTTTCSCRSGSAPTTSCRACSAPSISTIRRGCATRWSSPTGSSMARSRRTPSRRRRRQRRDAHPVRPSGSRPRPSRRDRQAVQEQAEVRTRSAP